MYANGEGLSQDYAEALKWYRLAATQGDARSQSNLGIMYANGQGVPRDLSEALNWFRLAAAQGDAGVSIRAYLEGKAEAEAPRPKDQSPSRKSHHRRRALRDANRKWQHHRQSGELPLLANDLQDCRFGSIRGRRNPARLRQLRTK
jgi:TPR repeat protein